MRRRLVVVRCGRVKRADLGAIGSRLTVEHQPHAAAQTFGLPTNPSASSVGMLVLMPIVLLGSHRRRREEFCLVADASVRWARAPLLIIGWGQATVVRDRSGRVEASDGARGAKPFGTRLRTGGSLRSDRPS